MNSLRSAPATPATTPNALNTSTESSKARPTASSTEGRLEIAHKLLLTP
ncbi:MAG: hypothetical protein H7Z77_06350, partial [Chitinophagaceae bacterium]|nr:hypothetical protein [Polaromonas sp.]